MQTSTATALTPHDSDTVVDFNIRALAVLPSHKTHVSSSITREHYVRPLLASAVRPKPQFLPEDGWTTLILQASRRCCMHAAAATHPIRLNSFCCASRVHPRVAHFHRQRPAAGLGYSSHSNWSLYIDARIRLRVHPK